MAPPLTLDGAAKTGDTGRDLLRLNISSGNTEARVFINGANAGRLGLVVYDEAHSALASFHAAWATFEAIASYVKIIGDSGTADRGGLLLNNTTAAVRHLKQVATFTGTPGTSSRFRIGWVADSDLETFLNSGAAIEVGPDNTVKINAGGIGPLIVGTPVETATLRSPSATALNLVATGAATIIFVTNSALRWQISSSGHLLAVTDASFDIGAAGATRPRDGYFSGTVTANAFAGDGSALTNLPAATPLNNQRVPGITNTVKLTYSLPAGKLGTDGNALRIQYAIQKGNGNAVNGLIKFGATTVQTVAMPAGAEQFKGEIIIRRLSGTTQAAYGVYTRFGTSAVVGLRTAPGETLSGAITISIEADNGVQAFDADHWTVELIP